MLFDTPVVNNRVAQEITIIKGYFTYTILVIIIIPIRAFLIKEKSDPNGQWNIVYFLVNIGTLVILSGAYCLCKLMKLGKTKIILVTIFRLGVCIICMEMPLLDKNVQKASFEAY